MTNQQKRRVFRRFKVKDINLLPTYVCRVCSYVVARAKGSRERMCKCDNPVTGVWTR